MQLMTMGVSDIKRAGIFVLTFKGWKCGLVPLSLFSLQQELLQYVLVVLNQKKYMIGIGSSEEGKDISSHTHKTGSWLLLGAL